MIELLDAQKVVKETTEFSKDLVNGEYSTVEVMLHHLYESGIPVGKSIIAAILIFFVGRYIINLVCRIIARTMIRRNVDTGVQTFINSFAHITFMVLLILTVISTLGINTTSIAALLASAGVAIGMAFSGNLSNFAGGIIILIMKPYKIGDYIEAQGQEGFVKSIQIFHTVLMTYSGKEAFIPNGAMSSGNILNWNTKGNIRVQWTIGIEYGEDTKKARRVLMELCENHPLLLKDPAPSVNLDELAASSVNLVVRVWTKTDNYWKVYYGLQEDIYEAFNKEHINFPFPQLQIHQ